MDPRNQKSKKLNQKKEKGSLEFREVMEITSGQSEGNSKIPNRIDKRTQEKIPDGMPLWRWRRRRKQTHLS